MVISTIVGATLSFSFTHIKCINLLVSSREDKKKESSFLKSITSVVDCDDFFQINSSCQMFEFFIEKKYYSYSNHNLMGLMVIVPLLLVILFQNFLPGHNSLTQSGSFNTFSGFVNYGGNCFWTVG